MLACFSWAGSAWLAPPADNVLLDFELSAKISDFGVSRHAAADTTLTAEVGTPLFSAPEMLCTIEPRYSQAVDVWAAGCVLVCLATNHRLPYSEEECASSKLLARVNRGTMRPALPDAELLSGCVRACCEFDPTKRADAAGLERATEALTKQYPRPRDHAGGPLTPVHASLQHLKQE